MALPALHRLSSALPNHDLRLVGRPLPALVLDGQGPWPKVAAEWASDRGGAALLLAPSFRVAWQALRSGCGLRIGTPTDWRRPLLTHSVPTSIRTHHQRDIYAAAVERTLAELRGRLQHPSESPPFSVASEGRRWWESVGRPQLVLHPWAAGDPAKRWPRSRWVELGRRARSVAITGGPSGDDAAFAFGLADVLGAPCAAGPSALSPAAWASLAQAAGDVVLPDTGLAHLAAAAGVVPLVLFGATDPRRYAPRGARLVVADSMADLDVDRVVAKLRPGVTEAVVTFWSATS
jgi:ADP-heptose:LPS heptosyltransferase